MIYIYRAMMMRSFCERQAMSIAQNKKRCLVFFGLDRDEGVRAGPLCTAINRNRFFVQVILDISWIVKTLCDCGVCDLAVYIDFVCNIRINRPKLGRIGIQFVYTERDT